MEINKSWVLEHIEDEKVGMTGADLRAMFQLIDATITDSWVRKIGYGGAVKFLKVKPLFIGVVSYITEALRSQYHQQVLEIGQELLLSDNAV